jgi:ATP-dependent RNA/DNA helicase IGHMBP2
MHTRPSSYALHPRDARRLVCAAYICRMDYFNELTRLLKIEQAEDRRLYQEQAESASITIRREAGVAWYPVAIRDTELTRGDYLSVEVERTTHQDLAHQLRFGAPAALFSNHDPANDRIEGTISFQGGNRLKLTLRTDELPDWARDGKLGIDLLFDDNSYTEMFSALRQAAVQGEKREEGRLVRILTGPTPPAFGEENPAPDSGHSGGTVFTASTSGHPLGPAPAASTSGHPLSPAPAASALGHSGIPLNPSQQAAVRKILSAVDLAIVHGPPGTGKTTTLVTAIRALTERDEGPVLVVAPSNTAVDLLSEKLADTGLNVLRIGNPAKVSDKLLSLTLDSRMAEHSAMKEVKKLKKRAAEFKDMAHKYKRSFGAAEREQRKALFDEARNIMKEVERTEQYILDDVIGKARVITATLVGASHYTIRNLRYGTAVIDEAGQALEPACWIPILKASRLVLAGDHCQLPPTVKSQEAAQGGLSTTLLEKVVALHPEAVTLLEEQYRMHQRIMGYPSGVFYENKLKAHPTVAAHTLFEGDAPLTFIDTAGCGFDERPEGPGLTNPEEAAFLVRHATRLLEDLAARPNASPPNGSGPSSNPGGTAASTNGSGPSGNPGGPAARNPGSPLRNPGGPAARTNGSAANGALRPTVAIISPYRSQVHLLQELVAASPVLREWSDRLSVNTIDSFQGQERDIVYIGMTRSNADSRVGFLAEIRRMNVAMTRARKKLVVIGDSATLSRVPFYEDFIAYAQEHQAYVSAWEFYEP